MTGAVWRWFIAAWLAVRLAASGALADDWVDDV